MTDQLATIFFGIGLILAFIAASQVLRIMPASPGQGDLGSPLTREPRQSIWSQLQMWLMEAELNWDLRDVALWCCASCTVVALLAMTMGLPVVWLAFLLPVMLMTAFLTLAIRRQFRLGEFRRQLPEVVTVVARAVRAGLSLEESLRLGEQSARGRLRSELGTCASQLRMGRSLSATLEAFSRRSGLREIGLVATILSVHQHTGGPLADALERLSLLLRDQLMFRQQVLAATSGGRFSAFLIAPAAPILFLFLLLVAPDHVAVFLEKPLGRTFLVFGTILNVVGVLWIYYLVKPQH